MLIQTDMAAIFRPGLFTVSAQVNYVTIRSHHLFTDITSESGAKHETLDLIHLFSHPAYGVIVLLTSCACLPVSVRLSQ